MKVLALIALVISLVVLQAPATRSQQLKTPDTAKQLVSSLETNTDRFSNSVDAALDRSRLDDSKLEDQFNALVDEFELETDDLKDQIDNDMVIAPDVREVLRRGLNLGMFMKSHKLTPVAQANWNEVKTNLDQLARAYSITWVWAPSTDTAMNRASTRQVISRLEQAADDFSESFDATLDRSRIDGRQYEDFMNKVVATFENTLDKLEDQSGRSGNLNADDFDIVLNNAKAIDAFLRRNNVGGRAMRDWARVVVNLQDLAVLNRLTWNWTIWMLPVTMNKSPRTQQQSSSQIAEGQRVRALWIARETNHASAECSRSIRCKQ